MSQRFHPGNNDDDNDRGFSPSRGYATLDGSWRPNSDPRFYHRDNRADARQLGDMSFSSEQVVSQIMQYCGNKGNYSLARKIAAGERSIRGVADDGGPGMMDQATLNRRYHAFLDEIRERLAFDAIVSLIQTYLGDHAEGDETR